MIRRNLFRNFSCNDDTEGTTREGSLPETFDSRPPAVPPKSQEIKERMQQGRGKMQSIVSPTPPVTSASNFVTLDDVQRTARNHFLLTENNAARGRHTELFSGELTIPSPTGSVLYNSKATPSDSGYETSRNVFDAKLNQQLQQDIYNLGSTSPLSTGVSDAKLDPQDHHPFSLSCPPSAFSRSDSNATEHTSGAANVSGQYGGNLSQVNPSNPFQFPGREEPVFSLASHQHHVGCGGPGTLSSTSSSRAPLSNRDSQTFSGCSNRVYLPPFNNNNNNCNSAAFSDDASVSSGSKLELSSNNPFKPMLSALTASQHNQISSHRPLSSENTIQIPNFLWNSQNSQAVSTTLVGNQHLKCSSAENVQNSNVVPVTASSCESVRSANQSERSSTSSIFNSRKVLSGLYVDGRSGAPLSGGLSPSSFGNWMPPDMENTCKEYNAASVNRINCKSSTLPRKNISGRQNTQCENSLEEHEYTWACQPGSLRDNSPILDLYEPVGGTNVQRRRPNRIMCRLNLHLRRKGRNPSVKIRDFIVELANDHSSLFHSKVEVLLQRFSKELDPSTLCVPVSLFFLSLYISDMSQMES